MGLCEGVECVRVFFSVALLCQQIFTSHDLERAMLGIDDTIKDQKKEWDVRCCAVSGPAPFL